MLAGVRSDGDAQSLRQTVPVNVAQRLHVLLLDIVKADSVARAAEQVSEITGADGLRGLVNNAGICVAGPVEFLSSNALRRQFDVNVFGQIAMTRAMLPLLRTHVAAHGRGSARIVMISSIAGRVAQPMVGAYCASKYALEAFSDALRIELRPHGIRVCVVQPGAIQSEIWRKALEQTELIPSNAPARQLYGKQMAAVEGATRRVAAGAIPADRVAKVVQRCLLHRRPWVRTLVGTDAKAAALLKSILPARWFDNGLLWVMRRAADQK